MVVSLDNLCSAHGSSKATEVLVRVHIPFGSLGKRTYLVILSREDLLVRAYDRSHKLSCLEHRSLAMRFSGWTGTAVQQTPPTAFLCVALH